MKYQTIVIDPPWPIKMRGSVKARPNQAKELPYNTMTFEEIENLSIGSIAEQGAHIYLWSTNATLRKSFEVLEKWGVNYHLTLVWVKPSAIAPCFAYKFATEFCLLGFYGKPMKKFIGAGKLNWLSHFTKAGEHSKKPECFIDLVESMSPAPRIELFARRHRMGWDVWGNEVESDIDLTPKGE